MNVQRTTRQVTVSELEAGNVVVAVVSISDNRVRPMNPSVLVIEDAVYNDMLDSWVAPCRWQEKGEWCYDVLQSTKQDLVVVEDGGDLEVAEAT